MSEPSFLLSRTLASTLTSTMEELQVQQTVQEQLVPPSLPLRKTSTWLSFRIFLRSRTRTLLQHLSIGFRDFGFSMLVGSMLSIPIYVCLLTLSGGNVLASLSLRPEAAPSGAFERGLLGTTFKALIQSPYRWNNGLSGEDVRLHAGWDWVPSTHSVDSEMVLSFDNDLEGPDSVSANGSVIFLLRARPFDLAQRSCKLLNETLWDPEMQQRTPLDPHLSYLGTVLKRPKAEKDIFWISHGKDGSRATSRQGEIKDHPDHHSLPVICTNSAPNKRGAEQQHDISSNHRVIVEANHERYVGYRDKRSFRFLGMRYASPTARWAYSMRNIGHKGTNSDKKLVDATKFGDMCAQAEGGSEDCLTLNVFTPYLPIHRKDEQERRKDTIGKKAVMVWIHGGSLASGSSRDPTFDGGNFASRGDVVVVTLNYRLGTLGFMALKDDETFGNFGLRDIATALEWVRHNIESFGGDPKKVTLVGQSAGAAAVRALLASHKVDKVFDKAIMMSTPGGLGHMDYFSKYLTSAEAYNRTSKLWLKGKGFNCKVRNKEENEKGESQLECLRKMTVEKILSLNPPANKFVRDGDWLRTTELRFGRHKSGGRDLNKPKIMLGWMKDDSASMIPFPKLNEMILDDYLHNLSLPNPLHTEDRDLFLSAKDSHANTSMADFETAVRISTDLNFRCAAQSTAFNAWKAGKRGRFFNEKGIYVYEFERSHQLLDYPKDPARNQLCMPKGDSKKNETTYFNCHSGELYYVFGNMAYLGIADTDGGDYAFSRMIVDTWAAFIRTGNPNLNADWLRARGYWSTLEHVERTKMWRAIGDKDSKRDPNMEKVAVDSLKDGEKYRNKGFAYSGESVRVLNWPASRNTGWRDVEQCAKLGIPLGFYRTKELNEDWYGLVGQKIDGPGDINGHPKGKGGG